VNAGNVEGKRHLPAFKTHEAAEHYRVRLLERKALQSPSALSDLTTLAAANVKLALERLEPYEASLLDAVDYDLSPPHRAKPNPETFARQLRLELPTQPPPGSPPAGKSSPCLHTLRREDLLSPILC
jgi:hypothetical protein